MGEGANRPLLGRIAEESGGFSMDVSNRDDLYGRLLQVKAKLGREALHGVKVELVTNAEPDAPPIAHHHVHFVNRDFVAMQQWYMKAFDATLRDGQTDFFIGADLPGVGYMLNFFSWLPAEDLVGTRGRAVDHVGFEVRNLEAFCAALAAKGIALTTPYRRDPELGIATAVITDPWGTVIELTEGLRR